MRTLLKASFETSRCDGTGSNRRKTCQRSCGILVYPISVRLVMRSQPVPNTLVEGLPLNVSLVKTPDISEYLDFGFHDWVTFRNNAGLGCSKIGRWLGVSHRVGQLMLYWILPASRIPISCTKVQRVTELEKKKV